MKSGDWVAVTRWCGLYDHHGVYVGQGRIVHFVGEPGQAEKRSARVAETSVEDFIRGGAVRVVRRGGPTGRRWAARARGAVGSGGYDLLSRNCEHFADWATGGEGRSAQVEVPLSRAICRGVDAATRSRAPGGPLGGVLFGLIEGFVRSRWRAMS